MHKKYKNLEIISICLFVSFLLILFFRPVETGDSWLHLSIARWMVDAKQVPYDESFPYMKPAAPWIHTQWLGSLIYYTVFSIGNIIGLKIFRAFIFLLIIGIFFVKARRYIPLSLLFIITYTMAQGLSYRCDLRPYVFNFIFIQIFLIFLYDFNKGYISKRIYLLPLISILWINIHIGCFVYGSILLLLFLAISFMELILNIKKKENKSFSIEKLKRLVLVLVMHILVLFLTPYGLKGVSYPFEVFFSSNIINRDIIFNLTYEMLPPHFLLNIKGNWWFFILFAGVFACIAKKKGSKYEYFLIFFVSVASILYSQRCLGFFILNCVYIIYQIAREENFIQLWNKSSFAEKYENKIYLVLNCIFIIKILLLMNIRTLYGYKYQRYLSMLTDIKNPSEVVTFLSNNNIKGRVLNWEGFGGYLYFSSYPNLKPLIDGRAIDIERTVSYLTFCRNPKEFYYDFQEEYKFDIVMLNARIDTALVKFFHEHDDWQLICLKGLSAVFVRKGVFQLSPEVNNYESHLEDTPYSSSEALRICNEIPVNDIIKLRSLFNLEPYFIKEYHEAVTLFALEYKNAASARILDVYKKAPFHKVRDLLFYDIYKVEYKPDGDVKVEQIF